MVICGKPAVTWFDASANQRHSTFYFPHSAIPHFTHSLQPPPQMVPKLTDISRISVVVRVSDHFVDGKLQLTE